MFDAEAEALRMTYLNFKSQARQASEHSANLRAQAEIAMGQSTSWGAAAEKLKDALGKLGVQVEPK